MLSEPVSVKFRTEYTVTTAEKTSGGYRAAGTLLKIENGKITVTSEETAPAFAEIAWEVRIPENALVYGDHWERGYGDLEWKPTDPERCLPWYGMTSFDGKVFCFGVKTLPGAICSWRLSADRLTLVLDLRCGALPTELKGRILPAAEVLFEEYEERPFRAAELFCRKMCDRPTFPTGIIYGGNDWYCCYGNNSREKILNHAGRIAECAGSAEVRPYMVVDDGWQLNFATQVLNGCAFDGGPWRYCNRKFGDMSRLCEDIRKMDVNPGVWFRPLFTAENISRDCLLQGEDGFSYLDPSCPEVLEYIAGEVRAMVGFGFRLLKHDYTSYDIFGRWGMQMGPELTRPGWSFRDRSRTSAEIIRELYRTIRKAAGPETLIIGCNTFGHLGTGSFDLQRTGDDTSGREWARTRKMGVNTLAFRMPQHNTFFAADSDCVGVTNAVDWRLNRRWLDILARSRTPLFVSIGEDAYGPEQKRDISAAFREILSGENSLEPLDWQETLTPTRWKTADGTLLEYNWDEV